MKKYRVTLTDEQLRLVAHCVEDIHRFLAGQTELNNAISMLNNYHELKERLEKLQPLVTPALYDKHHTIYASYSWSGAGCPDKRQRKAIAMTYGIYREILHHLAVENGWDNVYSSSTLRCDEQGEPIKIETIKPKQDETYNS